MKHTRGFTIIELLFIIVVLGIGSVFFFMQKSEIEIAARDGVRKTAINAMYYSLEEVYYKEHGSYPRTISSQVLPSMDADLFKDPQSVALGESDSDYQYEGTSCDGDACKSYTLSAFLENEDRYVKSSRH